ncbi:MAG: hypothetical protein K2Y10_05245 [Burkholderiaceae bacterium]|nr:hypothetical protein [Burkholderiaceae bacterium]
MSKFKFKRELETSINIAEWNPTDEQLLRIAKYIVRNKGDIKGVKEFISVICENVTWTAFEGVDNSDLNYLLALAIKTVGGNN